MSKPEHLGQELWNYPPSLSYGGTGCNTLRDGGLSCGRLKVERRLSMVEGLEAVVSVNLQQLVRSPKV